MSDQGLEEMDAEIGECSSHNDTSQAVSSQSAFANRNEQSSDENCKPDIICMSNNVASTTDTEASSLPSDQNSSSGMDKVDAETCAVGNHLPVSEMTMPEASEGAEAACGGNFDGFSGAELEKMIAHQQQLLNRIRAEQAEFLNQIERAKAEIHRAAETTYGAVDNCVNNLLASAAEIKSERAAQLERSSREMESTIASMNWHHMFAQELLKHGTPADVTHYAPLLQADAERIFSEPIPEVPRMTPEAERKLAALEAFASIDIEDLRRQAGGNLLGHVTHSEAVDTSPPDGVSPYLNEPKLIATTAVDNGVCGVAFLDVCLYVIRDRSSVVEVYVTSEGLVLQRQISVEQMTCPTAITACPSADCLFISDSQVSGLFRIPSSVDAEVTMIPLEGIPSSLSATANGCIVVIFADTRVIQMISAVDSSVTNRIPIDSISRPMSIVPVNGEDNGFLVCNVTDLGLDWFICGHRLEASARSLEEPIRLRSLRNISGLVPDPLGSYVAFSTVQNSIKLFDSTFALLRPLLRAPEGVEHPTALAMNQTSGRVAIGQENGIIKLYQLLQTRKKIEVELCNWS